MDKEWFEKTYCEGKTLLPHQWSAVSSFMEWYAGGNRKEFLFNMGRGSGKTTVRRALRRFLEEEEFSERLNNYVEH